MHHLVENVIEVCNISIHMGIHYSVFEKEDYGYIYTGLVTYFASSGKFG